jgi:hypothetical protein
MPYLVTKYCDDCGAKDRYHLEDQGSGAPVAGRFLSIARCARTAAGKTPVLGYSQMHTPIRGDKLR